MKRNIYRNRLTGRFVKKSTWKRSKAQGGTRYVRQRIEVKKRERVEKIEKPEIEEIQGGFDSPS